jgi:hypothetical protein
MSKISSSGGCGPSAPITAQYVTLALDPVLTAERVLTAGSGILITDNGPNSTVVISATGGGGAPTDATYLTLSLNGTLTDERVLTAGSGIGFVDTGANGSLTVNNTGVLSITGTAAQILVTPATGTSVASLIDTAVTPATYGDATHVGQFTVDQQGRLTFAQNVLISGGGGGGTMELLYPLGLMGG